MVQFLTSKSRPSIMVFKVIGTFAPYLNFKERSVKKRGGAAR